MEGTTSFYTANGGSKGELIRKIKTPLFFKQFEKITIETAPKGKPILETYEILRITPPAISISGGIHCEYIVIFHNEIEMEFFLH